MSTPWDDLTVEPEGAGRYTGSLSPAWSMALYPQGGISTAVAVEAMAAELADPGQRLRSATAVFAGPVAAGPVICEVTVLRRGRSMSQLSATLRNVDAPVGLTVLAVFGSPRPGHDFVDVDPPSVLPPEGLRSYRDPLPDGVDASYGKRPRFWEEIMDARPALGRPPWEAFEPGPSDVANWFEIDEPPEIGGGLLHPAVGIVACDLMPPAVSQKVGVTDPPWYGPSADLTYHPFGDIPVGRLLGHCRARVSGQGYASLEMTLWPEDLSRPLAHATQLMFFTVLDRR